MRIKSFYRSNPNSINELYKNLDIFLVHVIKIWRSIKYTDKGEDCVEKYIFVAFNTYRFYD